MVALFAVARQCPSALLLATRSSTPRNHLSIGAKRKATRRRAKGQPSPTPALIHLWGPRSVLRPSPIRTVPSAPELHRILRISEGLVCLGTTAFPDPLRPEPSDLPSRALPPIGNWEVPFPHPAPKVVPIQFKRIYSTRSSRFSRGAKQGGCATRKLGARGVDVVPPGPVAVVTGSSVPTTQRRTQAIERNPLPCRLPGIHS